MSDSFSAMFSTIPLMSLTCDSDRHKETCRCVPTYPRPRSFEPCCCQIVLIWLYMVSTEHHWSIVLVTTNYDAAGLSPEIWLSQPPPAWSHVTCHVTTAITAIMS